MLRQEVAVAFRGQLTASADVFFKGWTFALASVTFGRHEFVRRCAAGGGGGGGTNGGGGLGGPSPGTPLPSYDHVTPVASTAGPAGYRFFVAGPPCSGQADETAQVWASYASFGNAPAHRNAQRTLQPGQVLRDWRVYVATDTGPPGPHPAVITCELTGPSGTRIAWKQSLTYTITSPSRQLQLANNAPHAGGDLVFRSGASGGGDECPHHSGHHRRTAHVLHRILG